MFMRHCHAYIDNHRQYAVTLPFSLCATDLLIPST